MKYKHRPFVYYAVLSCVYIILSLVLPVNRHTLMTYHLTLSEYHILILAILLPLVAIWFAAFYGYAKLKDYAASVRKSREGQAFKLIAQGAAWLAWMLPITSILSVILNGIAVTSPGFHGTAIIINNYVTLSLSLIAFYIISKGTRRLTESARLGPTLFGLRNVMAVFIAISVIFCYVILTDISRAQDGSPYHLPTWALLLTVITPYLYAWFLGLLAVYEIALYSRLIKGVLYKQALNLLSLGIVGIIITSITIQYLSSLAESLSRLTLEYLLAIIYLLLIIYAIGFGLVALGAQKLRKIEEV